MKFAHAANLLKGVAIVFFLIAPLCLPSQVLAAGSLVVSVSAPTQAISAGTQFTVNITVQPNMAIAGAQFNLSFNPSLVSVDSVTEGNLFNQNGASTYFTPGNINNTAGTVTWVADVVLGSGNCVSNPGTFAMITMTAGANSGTSPLTLSNVIVGDINAQPLSVTLVSGQVVITATTTTTPTTTTTTPITTTAPTTTTTTTPITTTAPTTTTTTTSTVGSGGGSGGGEGGGLTGPATLGGVTNITSAVNSQGVLNQDVNAYSDDNDVLLHVAAGTTALSSSGAPLSQISLIHITTPPAFLTGAGMIGLAYDFTPGGTTFSPAAIVRFSYDPTLMPAGVMDTSLQIAYYDDTQNVWISLPSTVDATDHFISAEIAHFTTYAVTYGVTAVSRAPETNTPTTTTPLTTVPTTTSATATVPLTTTTTTTTVTKASTITSAATTNTPVETTSIGLNATTSTTTPMLPAVALAPLSTTNTTASTSPVVVRMYILAAAIGVAVFLITFTGAIIWLQHRSLLKKHNHLN